MVKLSTHDKISQLINIKSIILFRFMENYDIFEKEVRRIFELKIRDLTTPEIYELYYLQGQSIIKNIDIINKSTTVSFPDFSDKEKFKSLTLNQILKFYKNKHTDYFNFEVDSLQKKMIKYTFVEIAQKLVNMRNRLAHELKDVKFDESCRIDRLSEDMISEMDNSFFKIASFNIWDEICKDIVSNYFYMLKILEKLKNIAN